MGNAPSAPTSRRRAQNRLSKPKTNNASTTTLLLSLKDPPPAAGRSRLPLEPESIISTRYSDLPIATSDPKEVKLEEPRKRISLFKSLSSSQGKQQKQQQQQQYAIDTGVDRDPRSPTPVDRPVHDWSKRSRSASATVREPIEVPIYIRPSQRPNRRSLQPTRPSQTSLRQSLHSLHSTSQLELSQEPTPSRYDANGAPASPLGPRTNAEAEPYGPIRRRSLLQPGLATRRSFVEGDPRQSLPSQRLSRELLSTEEPQDDHDERIKPQKPTLLSAAALRKRLNEPPGPRTETPDDMSYGHIGAFKLGSLRITNGAASPTPSTHRPSTSISEKGRPKNHRDADPERLGLGQRSRTCNIASDKPWAPRSESPLLGKSYERASFKPLTLDTHLAIPDTLFSHFTLNVTDSPTRSIDLARAYMENLCLSPFSFQESPLPSPLPSPDLQVTSKHTALEDDLFSIEGRTPSPDGANRASRSLDSGYDAALASPREGQQEAEEAPTIKPLAKADSGYSSNVSLRSFRGKGSKPAVPTKEAPPTPPKEGVESEPTSRMASSNYSINSLPTSTRESAARRDVSGSSQSSRIPASRAASSTYSVASYPSTASDVTLKGDKLLHSQALAEPTSRNASSNYSLDSLPSTRADFKEDSSDRIPSPRPSVPSKSPEQLRKASQPKPPTVNHTPPIQPPATDTNAMAQGVNNHADLDRPWGNSFSLGAAAEWRVGSKRPVNLDPQLYTVQAMRPNSPALSIPPIPQETSRRLGERVDAFPVASIPNTLTGDNALRRTLSKETLGTIFSVGSAEQRESPTPARLQGALPPVPKASPILRTELQTPVTFAQSTILAQDETRTAATRIEASRRHTRQIPDPLPSLGYTIASRTEARQHVPPTRESETDLETTTKKESRARKAARASSEPPASGSRLSAKIETTPFVPQSIPSALSTIPAPAQPRSKPVESLSNTGRESRGGLRGAYKLQEGSSARVLEAKTAPTPPPESRSDPTPAPAATRPFVPARHTDPVRSTKRKHPPQAHEKYSRASIQRQLTMFENSLLALQQGHSNMASGVGLAMPDFDSSTMRHSGARHSTPPPVTMQTQKKLMPVNLKAMPFYPPQQPQAFPPSLNQSSKMLALGTHLSQFPSPPPNYPPPLPLIARATNKQASPQASPKPEVHDPWAAQKWFWSSQRQSADALQSRQSQDLSRPGSTRTSIEHPRPRLQPQSSDDFLASQSRELGLDARRSLGIWRPGSAAPVLALSAEETARRSFEFHRWQRAAEQQVGVSTTTANSSRRASLESTQSWHAWRNVVMQQSQQHQQLQAQQIQFQTQRVQYQVQKVQSQQIRPPLSHRSSVESTHSFQSARSTSKSVSFSTNISRHPSYTNNGTSAGTYDHTYGMRPTSHPSSDARFYDGSSEASESYDERRVERRMHPSSTDDMLVLRRLSSFRSETEAKSPNWTVCDDDDDDDDDDDAYRKGDSRDDTFAAEFRKRASLNLRRAGVGA